jgi:hypothetical protein
MIRLSQFFSPGGYRIGEIKHVPEDQTVSPFFRGRYRIGVVTHICAGGASHAINN